MVVSLCRYLRTLKQTIGNKARVEGSIRNAYLVKETTTFCSYYFEQHIADEFVNVERNVVSEELLEGVDPNNLSVFTFTGKPVEASYKRHLNNDEVRFMQTYVLCNCPEVQEYIQ